MIYLAHPQEPLKEHLQLVWNECRKFAKTDEEKAIFFLVGAVHDFGKYNILFQEKLNGKINDNIRQYSEHSKISAMFFLYISVINKLDKRYILAWFNAILSHHWDLKNIDFTNITFWQGIIDYTQKQIEFFNLDFETEIKEILPNNFKFSLEEFKNFLNQPLEDLWKYIKKYFSELKIDCEIAFLIRWMYSALIYSDKYKTIFQKDKIETKRLTKYNIIDEYRQKMWFNKDDTSLNQMRNEIYKKIDEKVKNLDLEKHHILLLNAHTGSWKTLNLLNIACKLKQRLETEKWVKSKIVYTLPFTSIIDQVYENIIDIFEKLWLNAFDFVDKVHYLSSYNENNDYIEKENQARFLYQNWEKEIIVSTFVQLFATIFSNKNKNLIKFVNFKNTIFILDEIQATPYKYWWLFQKIFDFLSEKLNCYFILSSATLPKFEWYNLLDNYEKYFQQINRTKLNINLKKQDLEIFKENIKNSIKTTWKDHLIVLNTIKSSIDVYNFLKEIFQNIYYLSSNIIPKHRKKRINQIKSSKDHKIVVSTQVIEAGVDIDLDIWFRDFAPLDSVIQTLWRINRNNKKQQGSLNLVNLINENWKTYSSFVYEFLALNKTEQTLNWLKNIEEKSYLQVFEKYFDILDQTRSKDEENKIYNHFCNLDFEEVSKQVKLIDKQWETINVFVQIDKKAVQLWEEFVNIKNNKDVFERKKLFEKIKKDFMQYVVTAFVEDLIKNWLLTDDINWKLYYKWWFVPILKNNLNKYYDLETWLKKEILNDDYFI